MRAKTFMKPEYNVSGAARYPGLCAVSPLNRFFGKSDRDANALT